MLFFVSPEGRDSPHDLRIWSLNWTNLENSQQYLDQHLEIALKWEDKNKRSFWYFFSLCLQTKSPPLCHCPITAQTQPQTRDSNTKGFSGFCSNIRVCKKTQARPFHGGQWPFVWQSETIWWWETSVCLLRASTIAIISGHCPADRPTMTILMQPRYGILHFSPWLSPSNMCLASREGKV